MLTCYAWASSISSPPFVLAKEKAALKNIANVWPPNCRAIFNTPKGPNDIPVLLKFLESFESEGRPLLTRLGFKIIYFLDTYTNETKTSLCSLLGKFLNLTDIYLEGRSEDLFDIFKECINIRNVVLDDTYRFEEKQFTDILRHWPSLQHLTMLYVGKHSLTSIIRQLGVHCTDLHSFVTLTYPRDEGNSELKDALAEFIELRGRKLTRLVLREIDCDENVLNKLATSAPNLQELDVSIGRKVTNGVHYGMWPKMSHALSFDHDMVEWLVGTLRQCEGSAVDVPERDERVTEVLQRCTKTIVEKTIGFASLNWERRKSG